MKRTVHSSLW